MLSAIAHLEQLNDIGEVLMAVRDFAASKGVIRQSYHFSPIFESPISQSTAIFSEGYSPEWLKLYSEMDFRRMDPIPERTLRFGSAITWLDAMQLDANTRENEAYFAAMREHGLVHGIGLPLYGPGYREAYASYDFGRPTDPKTDEAFTEIARMAQAGQVRVCRLLALHRDTAKLSDREQTVLEWMADGKSNSDIATILDISPETVRTYAKRIYEKLGANDRIGAILKGLKVGAIRLR